MHNFPEVLFDHKMLFYRKIFNGANISMEHTLKRTTWLSDEVDPTSWDFSKPPENRRKYGTKQVR